MILASFSSIDKSYPSRSILNGASGAVKNGERIALLGINGSGKTTLLEILAGKIESDSGSVEIPNSISRGYLPQTIEISGSEILLDYTISGLENLLQVKQRLDQIHDLLPDNPHNEVLLKEMGQLQRQFEALGGYAMEAKAGEVLRGLGFSDEEFKMKVIELSGGQRNRAALARTLISRPDLLLLDEPTNHLDISGLEFLESFMKSFQGGIIYVSHDRTFIQKTATAIWELTLGRISSYPGNYDNYIIAREQRLKSMMENYEAQKEMIERTEDFIRRNIAGQKTKQAKSRRKMLAKLERLERPPSADDVASIRFSGAERSTRIVVKCEQASFSYDGEPFLDGIDFEIERGDRIGLIGPNGSGKTTVIKLITGHLVPTKGRIGIGKKLTIGYYDQLTENLNQGSTPLATIWEIKPQLNEGQIRSYLARFLFRGDDVYRTIASFSGGEQSRLALARLIATAPNFLVLDEPTNHLDIPSREALEDALSEFDGTVLCVSHDRYFLDNFAERIFSIQDDTIKIYLGDFSYYRERYLASIEEQKAGAVRPKSSSTARLKARDKRVNPQLIQKIETEISATEDGIAEVEIALSTEETGSDWQKLSRLLGERDRLYAILEELYAKKHELLSL